MDLSLSVEQQAVQDVLRPLLAKEVTGAVVRAAEGLGFDAGVWDRLREAGMPGLAAAPELGGDSGDLGVLVSVAREVGRAVAPAPIVEHLVATRLLADLAPDDDRLAALLAGEQLAAFAPRPARARRATLVPGGAVAALVIALDGEEVVVVTGEPPMAAVANHAGLPLADRDLAVSRQVAASGGPAQRAFRRAGLEWQTLTAASLAGIAEVALEMAVAYAKERHQFGVPIGSFQAVQHGLADVAGPVDAAWLLANEAAWALQTGESSATGATPEELAVMAYRFAGDAARQATARCVQYHGGYGVAEEYDAQLLFRRARGLAVLAGKDVA